MKSYDGGVLRNRNSDLLFRAHLIEYGREQADIEVEIENVMCSPFMMYGRYSVGKDSAAIESTSLHLLVDHRWSELVSTPMAVHRRHGPALRAIFGTIKEEIELI